MADERATPLNQGVDKWLQITDGGKLQTWNGVDSPTPIIGDDPLVTKTELDDKASLSGSFSNVKWYGAVGDGVADDTSFIQMALDSTNSVLIPKGTYRITDTLLIPSGTRLIGQGIDSTIIQQDFGTDTNKPIFINKNNAYGSAVDVGIYIEGIKAVGEGPDNPTSYGPPNNTAFKFKNVEKCQIENCYGTNVGAYAVAFNAAVDCIATNCYANHCGDDGFECADSNQSDIPDDASISRRNKFNSCYSTNAQNSGFECDDGPKYIEFNNCIAFNNRTDGFTIHYHADTVPPQHITFNGCTSIGHVRNFRLDNNSTTTHPPGEGWNLYNCEIFNGNHGVQAHNLQHSKISNLSIYGCSGDGITLRDGGRDISIPDLMVRGVGRAALESPGNPSHLHVTNPDVYDTGRHGILLNGDDSSLKGGRISGVGQSADLTFSCLTMNGNNQSVQGVTARIGDLQNAAVRAIYNFGSNALIIHNDVRDSWSSPIRNDGTMITDPVNQDDVANYNIV